MKQSTKRNLPTLEDVAKAAGVSTATVSRCLNEPDKVSEKTRTTVMEAVNALNYAPNFGARAIAANRTGIFGAVIPTMENAIFARGVEAFQKSLLSKNATMLVASSDYDPEQEARHIRTLVGRGADGLLLIGFQRDANIYEFLAERGIPIVSAWGSTQDPNQSYVGFNNKQASKILVEKAISMGHSSFGYITARTSLNDRAKARVEGAKLAIDEAGFQSYKMPVVETDYSIENGKNAFIELMSKMDQEAPSLIICGNDVLAVGAIQGAKSLGMKIPEEISIVGYDDIELSTVVSPALTTVHVPHQDMGRIAAECLYDLVTDSSDPKQIELPTHIVMRDSLGPARKNKS